MSGAGVVKVHRSAIESRDCGGTAERQRENKQKLKSSANLTPSDAETLEIEVFNRQKYTCIIFSLDNL
jgi:hypothetical protein